MDKPILWGGFEIGAGRDEVLVRLADSRIVGGNVVADLRMLDCEFKAELEFDALGLSSVDLHFVRTLENQYFSDVLASLISAISAKHGRGEARSIRGSAIGKKWREPWVTIELVAIDDHEFETMLVMYRKIAITDAVYRYL
jgi:hypothetical protein